MATEEAEGALSWASLTCAACCGALAALAIVGWMTGLPCLAGGFADFVPTAPLTAMVFLVCSAAVCLRALRRDGQVARLVWWVAVAVCLAAAGLAFLVVIEGQNASLERWALGRAGISVPSGWGMMAPLTGLLFLASGLAMAFMEGFWSPGFRVVAGWLSALVACAGFVMFTGYVYGTPFFYGGALVPVALPTSVCFVLLGAAISAFGGTTSVGVRTMVGPSVRARLLRVFVPSTLVAVLLVCWGHRLAFGWATNPALVAAVIALLAMALSGVYVSRVAGHIGGAIDRTERELARLYAFQRAITEVSETLIRSRDEKDLLDRVCATLARVPNMRLVWVGLVQEGTPVVKAAVGAGEGREYIDHIVVTRDDSPNGGGPVGLAIRTRQGVVINDTERDPRFTPWREEALKRGFRSVAGIPIVTDDTVYGALAVYSSVASGFRDDEVKLLVEVAGDVAVGMRGFRLQEQVRSHVGSLQRSLNQTVEAMGGLCEMRDPYIAGHDRRVAQLACAIARKIGLSGERVQGLQVAALLHDIGKIAVPAEILARPGRLSGYEFEIVKVHPQAGYEILAKIEFPWRVAEMVRQHHERLDGSGYPQGIKGDAMMEEARILAVADVMEAMSSHRPYRPALPVEEALGEITGRPERYDAAISDACARLFRSEGFKFD